MEPLLKEGTNQERSFSKGRNDSITSCNRNSAVETDLLKMWDGKHQRNETEEAGVGQALQWSH